MEQKKVITRYNLVFFLVSLNSEAFAPSSKDGKAPQAKRRENALVPSIIIRDLKFVNRKYFSGTITVKTRSKIQNNKKKTVLKPKSSKAHLKSKISESQNVLVPSPPILLHLILMSVVSLVNTNDL